MGLPAIPGEVAPLVGVARDPARTGHAGAGDFGNALEVAVNALEATQAEADAESTTLALGGGNLHETALALEKADVSMRVAVKARNKAVDAYQELMRMSV